MMNAIQPLVDCSLQQISLDTKSIGRANAAHRRILAAIAEGDAKAAQQA